MLSRILIFILFCSFIKANNIPDTPSIIDENYYYISQKIVELSEYLDYNLSYLVSNPHKNISQHIPKKTQKSQTKLSVDSFFQNHKYFDETDNAFVHIRTDTILQSKEKHDFRFNLSTQFPFFKSRESIKFFIDDLDLDRVKNTLYNEEQSSQVLPEIGVHYFIEKKFGISSRYSLAFHGFTPFSRAKYSMNFQYKTWIILLMQTFKYATDDGFEEESNIYFDKVFPKDSLLRIQLHRKTQKKIDGMNYALAIGYYWSIMEKTNLHLSQEFYGNSKYAYEKERSIELPSKGTFGGINNYKTSVSWRHNIWRDWFFYEIQPTINFHKNHAYKPNYGIYIFFDFYFGKYR